MISRAIGVLCVAAFVFLLLVGASGFVLFTNAKTDRLQRADAVVVLGGEHDGREEHGIALARSGWAPAVLISNPYQPSDPVMRRACAESGGKVEVICLPPFPSTTRGEAEMARRLANQREWRKIIVVTWKYHVPRARRVFRQCFSPDPNAVVMEAVPRHYDYSPAQWEYIYAYQYGGLLKAAVLGDCD